MLRSRSLQVALSVACSVSLLGGQGQQAMAENSIIYGGVMVEGRTLLPLRSIVEELGGEIAWDPATQTITITKAGRSVVMGINRKSATVNGNNMYLDVPPTLIQDKTYVPVRLVSEALGGTIQWNPKKLTVDIQMDEEQLTVDVVAPLLEISDAAVEAPSHQYKNEIYELMTWGIDLDKAAYNPHDQDLLLDSLYYGSGHSDLPLEDFITALTAEKEEQEGYFAFNHFVTEDSLGETILEMIPIGRPSFVTGYDFRDVVQYERWSIRSLPSGGVSFFGSTTWIPSSGEYYQIIDAYKEEVQFEFEAIRAAGRQKVLEVGLPAEKKSMMTLQGIEDKYDEYVLEKHFLYKEEYVEQGIEPTAVYPSIELKKVVNGSYVLVHTNRGMYEEQVRDMGDMDAYIEELLSWGASTPISTTKYRNATVVYKPLDNDGYYETILIPSNTKDIFYVGTITIEKERTFEAPHLHKVKKEHMKPYLADIAVLRDAMIDSVLSME